MYSAIMETIEKGTLAWDTQQIAITAALDGVSGEHVQTILETLFDTNGGADFTHPNFNQFINARGAGAQVLHDHQLHKLFDTATKHFDQHGAENLWRSVREKYSTSETVNTESVKKQVAAARDHYEKETEKNKSIGENIVGAVVEGGKAIATVAGNVASGVGQLVSRVFARNNEQLAEQNIIKQQWMNPASSRHTAQTAEFTAESTIEEVDAMLQQSFAQENEARSNIDLQIEKAGENLTNLIGHISDEHSIQDSIAMAMRESVENMQSATQYNELTPDELTSDEIAYMQKIAKAAAEAEMETEQTQETGNPYGMGPERQKLIY